MAEGKNIPQENSVKKETLYVAICIALVAGFLSGVIFSAFKGGPMVTSSQSSPQQSAQQGTSSEDVSRILALEKEIALNPNNLQAIIELGHKYFDTKQHQKAITMYTKALEIDSSNADIWTDLGVMYRRNNQPQQALEAFDRAMKENPQHEVSRFNKGIVLLYDIKDKNGAIKIWQSLLKMNPAATAPNGMPLGEFISQVEQEG